MTFQTVGKLLLFHSVWGRTAIVTVPWSDIPVYIYETFHIYHFTSIPHVLIRTHKWPAPNVSGFIAQLVRASHRYRKVTGSNPVEVLTLSGFYTQLLKLRSLLYCAAGEFTLQFKFVPLSLVVRKPMNLIQNEGKLLFHIFGESVFYLFLFFKIDFL